MYSSHLTYRIIADDLHQKLHGYQLSTCFSSDRDDLTIEFSKAGGHRYQLLMRFAGGEMFFTEPPHLAIPGFRAIRQFKSIENQTITSVEAVPYDRSLIMRFEDQSRLVFKGYGKFGNILLFPAGDAVPESIFRLHLKADWEITGDMFRGHQAEALELSGKTGFLPAEQLELISNLKASGMENGWLEASTRQLAAGNMVEEIKDGLPWLRYGVREGTSIGTGMPALILYAGHYLRAFHFQKEKSQRLADLRNRLKHLVTLRKELDKRLTEVRERRSYRELGDIILTYAHLVKPGISSAFLHDYYRNEQIRVKLDPNLDAAGNAEKYYGKARNEVTELKTLEQNLAITASQVQLTEERLAKLESVTDFAGLKAFRTGNGEKSKNAGTDTRPYREIEVEGYTVWVGKNAKSNDQMLRLAGKSDLWLHARDVSGSHVIIRKKGRDFPQSVIGQAARLAALNSKAKRQDMVPVIYTERKYVSKPRNAAPGEVALLRENILDVFLKS